MKIGEVYSLDLDDQLPLFANFSRLPTKLLEWMGHHLSDAFIVWDEKEQIRFVTQSVKRLLGYNRDELLGEVWYERVQPLEVERIRKYLKEDRKEGIRAELFNKKEQLVYVEIYLAKIEDDMTGQTFVVSLLRDLTATKEARELIMQAEKMSVVGQLAASIAHEIRNPLTSIKGFLQLLQAGVNHKEEYYRIMQDEIEKIESITSELLFMAKPNVHRMKEEKVDKLIRDVVVLLQSQARLKNITIHVEDPVSGNIYCDSSQIKQVLINLVKNAIEAMDEPGEITLKVDSDEEYTIIHVKDEGIGVPEDMLERLGVAFFTTKENGTGLGLNITKDILENHGGKLQFNRNESKGSTFQLFFPKVITKRMDYN